MRALAIALALMFVAPIADAQPNPQALAQKRRERIKNRIRSLRAARLVEELGEATTGKILPILARYDDEFDKLLQARADIDRRIASASESPDGKAADKIIDEAVANQKAFWAAEDMRLQEIRKLLTPQQTARLLVVLPPLERRIQNQLRNAIMRMQNNARESFDDDDIDAPQAPPPPRPRR